MGWIFFIPAGIITTALTQFFFRIGNLGYPFIADLLSTGVEPWAFYLGSLALIPKFPVSFIILSSISYLAMHGYSIYLYHNMAGFTMEPWAETIISLVAIVSCLISAYWYSTSGLNRMDRVFDE